MKLVLLTFGEQIEHHYQASFAILTYLTSPQVSSVCVITDRPSFYQYFKDKIEIIEVNESQLKTWRGHYDFFWRIKIQAIKHVVQQAPGEDILYIDSDTFLAGDLVGFEAALQKGESYMHTCEGSLCRLQSKTERSMWRDLRGTVFGPVTIDENSEMWNAGVVLLPSKKAMDMLSLATQLCDGMCATRCTRRLIEQFSLSLALKELGPLRAADREIAHYWANKNQWNSLITEFFMYSKLTESTLEQDLNRVKELDFRKWPIYIKERNTKRYLKYLLDKAMPPKVVRYFDSDRDDEDSEMTY